MTRALLTWTVASRYRFRYRFRTAVNIRMSDEQAEGMRALAQETGRSQQELIREALSEYVRTYRLRGSYGPSMPSTLRPRSRSGQISSSRATVGCERPALNSECLSAHDLISGGP